MCAYSILSYCLEIAEDYKIFKEMVIRIENVEEKATYIQNIKNYENYFPALAYPIYGKYVISAIMVIIGVCFEGIWIF